MKNCMKHLILITKHRIRVLILCIKAGIPLQGFIHDLSKYSLTELGESIKYYKGNGSPIGECKRRNGYSIAWLHHKGRNKHHHEYWYDYRSPEKAIMMPYKYAVEMICDGISAGRTYNGKKWTVEGQIQYWNKDKETSIINEKTKNFVDAVFSEMSKNGVDATLNKKVLKKLYNQYCG